MLKKRIIPVILIDNNGKVFKTEKFDNPKYIGDVFNTIKILNEYEVDEIIILDIEATKKKLSPNYSLLEKISTESFVPLTYGGGIDNLEKIEKILSLGFEKISINKAAQINNQFFNKASKLFGNQSIVLSIDIKFEENISIFDYTKKEFKQINESELLKMMNNYNCGEYFFNFVDNDGLMQGYNVNIIQKLIKLTNKPLIVCGGAGKLSHLNEILILGNCSVACGSFFIYANENKGVLINYLDEDEKNSLPLEITN